MIQTRLSNHRYIIYALINLKNSLFLLSRNNEMAEKGPSGSGSRAGTAAKAFVPHPSIGAVTFWQGIVEISLRAVVIVSGPSVFNATMNVQAEFSLSRILGCLIYMPSCFCTFKWKCLLARENVSIRIQI